jgi:RNA recognition motif-containing protein
VRLVRDPATSLGKGFGYVHFFDPSDIEIALRLSGETFALPNGQHERQLRITICKSAKASKKSTKQAKLPLPQQNKHSGSRTLEDAKLRKVKKLKTSFLKKKTQKAAAAAEQLEMMQRQGGQHASTAFSSRAHKFALPGRSKPTESSRKRTRPSDQSTKAAEQPKMKPRPGGQQYPWQGQAGSAKDVVEMTSVLARKRGSKSDKGPGGKAKISNKGSGKVSKGSGKAPAKRQRR